MSAHDHKRTHIDHLKNVTLRKISATPTNNMFELNMTPTGCPAKLLTSLLVFEDFKRKVFILEGLFTNAELFHLVQGI